MDIDDMLRKLNDGAELLSQTFEGRTDWWFRTFRQTSMFDVSVNSADAKALIDTGYVDQIELETDCEGTWFRGFSINDAGRERVAATGPRLH
ncbi:MAG: hypothetical protein J0H40_17030 [Rhizobiales bacterium]|nr:hypothetical protein [Hyphomicrobiales bacterium]